MRTLLAAVLLFVALGWIGVAAAVQQTSPHNLWTDVLVRFVDEMGLVDYDRLLANRDDFDVYIGWLRTNGPKSTPEAFPTRNHKLAYYLNAYNALVFKGVLSRGPERSSVWRGLVSGRTFFRGMEITFDGEFTNLQTLEDVLIRDGFKDPRIHAALNCASVSCPRLPRSAFLPEDLDVRLDAVMTEFVRDHVQYVAGEDTARLSKIFDWFRDDFLEFELGAGNANPDLLDYVNRYRAVDARIPKGTRVRFLDYDKGINAQRR